MTRDLKTAEYFTTGEVAIICKVAPRTVHKWVDSGRLPATKLPTSNHRRVTRKDLIVFLNEHSFNTDAVLSSLVNNEPDELVDPPLSIKELIEKDMEVVFSGRPLSELTESQLELRKLIDKMVTFHRG